MSTEKIGEHIEEVEDYIKHNGKKRGVSAYKFYLAYIEDCLERGYPENVALEWAEKDYGKDLERNAHELTEGELGKLVNKQFPQIFSHLVDHKANNLQTTEKAASSLPSNEIEKINDYIKEVEGYTGSEVTAYKNYLQNIKDNLEDGLPKSKALEDAQDNNAHDLERKAKALTEGELGNLVKKQSPEIFSYLKSHMAKIEKAEQEVEIAPQKKEKVNTQVGEIQAKIDVVEKMPDSEQKKHYSLYLESLKTELKTGNNGNALKWITDLATQHQHVLVGLTTGKLGEFIKEQSPELSDALGKIPQKAPAQKLPEQTLQTAEKVSPPPLPQRRSSSEKMAALGEPIPKMVRPLPALPIEKPKPELPPREIQEVMEVNKFIAGKETTASGSEKDVVDAAKAYKEYLKSDKTNVDFDKLNKHAKLLTENSDLKKFVEKDDNGLTFKALQDRSLTQDLKVKFRAV